MRTGWSVDEPQTTSALTALRVSVCRFADDVLDFEEFMTMLFELQIVNLQTTKP
jgi:hypothetical protein